jgi:hypothetical protein
MKHTVKLLTAVSALAFGLFATSAQAGPGPHQTFAPVKSAQEAEALKPGTMIAVTCPACGAVTTMKVDKEKSHMHSVMCGACKHSFEIVSVGGGKATMTQLVCKDPTTGKKMPLHMCAEMH